MEKQSPVVLLVILKGYVKKVVLEANRVSGICTKISVEPSFTKNL